MGQSPWFPYVRRRPGARVRLFCLPHAGGSAGFFRPWFGLFPEWVDVFPVQPPGRETRIRETPHLAVADYARELSGALGELLELPYVIFGHSMGAIVGFELVRLLERLDRPLPRELVLSAHQPPHGSAKKGHFADQDEQTILSRLREHGGTPDEVLNHRELRELVIGTLRADSTVLRDYRPDLAAPPLQTPLTPFGATDDPEVSPQELAEWARYSVHPRPPQIFEGGHFYLQTSRASVLEALLARLAAAAKNP